MRIKCIRTIGSVLLIVLTTVLSVLLNADNAMATPDTPVTNAVQTQNRGNSTPGIDRIGCTSTGDFGNDTCLLKPGFYYLDGKSGDKFDLLANDGRRRFPTAISKNLSPADGDLTLLRKGDGYKEFSLLVSDVARSHFAFRYKAGGQWWRVDVTVKFKELVGPDVHYTGEPGFFEACQPEDTESTVSKTVVFQYGSFAETSPDGQKYVRPGTCKQIGTDRKRVDYVAIVKRGKHAGEVVATGHVRVQQPKEGSRRPKVRDFTVANPRVWRNA